MVNDEGLKVRMKHYLVFDNVTGSEDRKLQYILDTPPILILANSNSSTFLKTPQMKSLNMLIEHCFLKDNIRFYLKDIDNQKFLLRFMNNDPFKTIKFNMNYELEELSLSANQNKKDMIAKRLKWNRKNKVELVSIKSSFLENQGDTFLNTISKIYV